MKAKKERIPRPSYSVLAVDRKKCSACGLCIDMCPMDVLRLGEDNFPVMRYPDECWYCDACVAACPRKALTLTGLPYLIR